MSDSPIYAENYNERAFVVRGETGRFKHALKNLGGRWNPNLKNGPGWIFSIRQHKNSVDKFLLKVLKTQVEEMQVEKDKTEDTEDQTENEDTEDQTENEDNQIRDEEQIENKNRELFAKAFTVSCVLCGFILLFCLNI